MYENLNKSDKDIQKATSKRFSKSQLLKTADEALNEYMNMLLGMDVEDQMTKFNLMTSRSPFLTPYSALLGRTAIMSDSKFANPDNYKDILHISRESGVSYADLLKADWDGDIIGARVLFQRASGEFRQQLLTFIQERTKVIDNTREIFKEELKQDETMLSSYDLKSYQEALIKNSRTVTNVNMAESLKNIILSGNQYVGANNYTDEQTRAAFSWYRNVYKEGNVSGEFDLASNLYNTVMTQLGQQVGISAKQMGSLLLNDKGEMAFTASTAAELFNAMTQETKNKYGWGGENGETLFTEQFNDMFKKAVVNTFGKMNIGEALTNMQARGLTGTGDTKEEEFYRKMAFFLSSENKNFSASDFFSTLMSADGMKDMFSAIYDKNNRNEINDYFTHQFTDKTGLVATRVFASHDMTTQEARLAQIVTEATMAQYAAREAVSGQKVSLINQQLSQLISLVQQIADNSGAGGSSSGKGGYTPNKAWERILENAKETEVTARNNATAELETKNGKHYYKSGLGEKGEIYSATQIGNGVLEPTNPNLKAQLAYFKQEIEAGRKVNSGINFDKWAMSGFRGSERDLTLPMSIEAASLVGNMYHRASELAIKQVQDSNGAKTISDIINDNDWVNSINSLDKTGEYQRYFDQLVLLFNGSTEMANAYIKTRGTIQENLKAGLSALLGAGVKEDASNVKTEEPLIARINGKDKEGNVTSYNVAATLDNIVRDTVTGGFTSVDLKQKDTNGQISPADAIEGLVQRYLLMVKSTNKNWLRDHGVTNEELNDPERLKQIQDATANSFTQFLKVSNGEAVLKSAGVEMAGMSPGQMVYALIQEYLKGGGLTWQDLPMFQAFSPDYEGSGSVGFDTYKEQYKNKLQIQEEISKLESATTGLTPEQQAARNSQLELLRERLALTEKILGFTNQEKFTQEQLNELNLMRARSESRIADSKAKGQGNTSLSGQFMNSLNRRIERFFEFTMVQNVLNKLIGSIKQVIQYTQKLDACLVDIRIATGYSITQTRQLLLEYNNLAKQVGKTTEEVAKAANDWLRAGYEGKEATELVTASMYLSTLGMMESSQATEALISVLKGWKLQSDEVMGVVDKLVTGTKNSVCLVIGIGHKFNCR